MVYMFKWQDFFPPSGAASEHLDEQVRGVLPSRGEQLAKETDGG